MREDRPSTTASVVAFARAVASLPTRHPGPTADPFATHFLPTPVERSLRALPPESARTDAAALALRAVSFGLVDHMALRTAAIDDALRAALAESPARQLVILGAGLDARAFRLPELERAHVFEVDHPATQRFKRARARGLLPRCAAHSYVAVDFERDDLGARLEEEGHDAASPTVWLWEGVVPYLAPEATRATLSCIAERSAEHSRLLVTYGTPLEDALLRRLARPVDLAFRVLGEPLRGLVPREAFHAALRETGWTPRHDTGPHDWRARYGWAIPLLLRIEERLAVADATWPRA